MVEEMKKRAAYAQAVIAAGDRYRKERDVAEAELKEAFKTANDGWKLRMNQAMQVYDQETKAAAVQYEREDK